MNDSDHAARTNIASETMTMLGAKATKVFMALVDGLLAGDARRADNSNGISWQCRSTASFATKALRTAPAAARSTIAHRYEPNGDLVPDPDVEF
jgi:hypothetical protein